MMLLRVREGITKTKNGLNQNSLRFKIELRSTAVYSKTVRRGPIGTMNKALQQRVWS